MNGALPEGAIAATSLEYWSSLGNLSRVVATLESNPDVNIRGEDGYTAMHAAAENGHLEVLRFLVGRGAELSPRVVTGETPLDLAVLADQHQAADFLISIGAE